MADIVTAIVDLLKADAEVSALADDRIYGDELPQAAVAMMPANALVIRASGGASFQPGGEVGAEAQRIDLVAFGATPFEADVLRRHAGITLRAARRRIVGTVLIHWINPAGGYLTARDPDTAAPYAFQSFQSLFATDEVD